MAEDKSLTPEQQLLKLIEESNKASKGAKGASPAVAAKTVKGPSRFSLMKIPGVLAGRLAFWRRGAAKRRPSARKISVNIADINKVFSVAVVCLLAYVVFDAVASARNLQRPPNFAPPKDMKAAFKTEAIEPLKESSYYLQKVSSRDIFKEGKKVETVKQVPAQNAVVETAEAIKNLALVGISWSSNPDAIIEDKSHQRTFFVKRGQMVGDNVKVEAIFKDHVVVTFEDHEYELR